MVAPEILPISDAIPRRAKRYRTTFTLPFIEWANMAPPMGYDEVMELVFRNSADVSALEARINGRTVPVYTFRGASQVSYCVELVGEVSSAETNTFELFVTWNRDADDPSVEPRQRKSEPGGPMVVSGDP